MKHIFQVALLSMFAHMSHGSYQDSYQDQLFGSGSSHSSDDGFTTSNKTQIPRVSSFNSVTSNMSQQQKDCHSLPDRQNRQILSGQNQQQPDSIYYAQTGREEESSCCCNCFWRYFYCLIPFSHLP